MDPLQGYLAAAERAGEAERILAHMAGSLQLNPAWVRMQQNITGNVSGIVAETNAHISRLISDGYWSRQATVDELSRRRSNQILGVEDVREPLTGRELKVESGSNRPAPEPGFSRADPPAVAPARRRGRRPITP